MGLICCKPLDPNKSIIIDDCTSKEIRHGPGWKFYAPWVGVKVIDKIILNAEEYLIVTHFTQKDDGDIIEHVPGPHIYSQDDAFAEVSKPQQKVKLSNTQYVICTDTKTGNKVTIKGPTLYMPKPYENVSAILDMILLNANQYVKIIDANTGHIEIKSGPLNYALEPFEKSEAVKNKVELSITQYTYVTDTRTGHIQMCKGPQQFVPGPYDLVSDVKNMISLANNQYVFTNDKQTGILSLVKGPKTFPLTAFESASEVRNAICLSMMQWAKVLDLNSGTIKIVKGPDTIYLTPYEKVVVENGKEIQDVYAVDANHCVHIRDIDTGVEKLITEPQKYVPEAPNIQVVATKELIKLAPYEYVILMDRDSNLIFKSGRENPGFFIPPFCQVYTQSWSTERNRNVKHNKKVERFDLRPHDMDFEFSVRSGDNVEVFLVVNVYWSIIDIEKMVRKTDDPPQDICNHVRSQILSFASKMTTKELMEYPAAEIVKQIQDSDNTFYDERGVHVSRINILEKRCADPDVEKSYRAIIDQKIARASNLEQQLGENDKEVARIKGLTKTEIENGELLQQKLKNMMLETETAGKTDGGKIKAFLDGLGDEIPLNEKINIFMQLERTKRINLLTSKVDKVYLNPNDADFNLNVVRVEDNNSDNKTPISVMLNKTSTTKLN